MMPKMFVVLHIFLDLIRKLLQMNNNEHFPLHTDNQSSNRFSEDTLQGPPLPPGQNAICFFQWHEGMQETGSP